MANATQVQAIFFDAVGTLIRPEPAVAVVYAAAGVRHGFPLPEEEVFARFQAAWKRQMARDEADGWRSSEGRELDRWQRIVAEVFHSNSPALFSDLWHHFAQPVHWATYPEVAGTLRTLAARGQRLFITSNFDARLHGIVRGLPTLAPIERVFVSTEVGWKKTAPAFWQRVLAEVGVPPSEGLVVGDSVRDDVQVPQALGMRALHLERDGPRSPEPIENLAELLRKSLQANDR